MSRAWLRLCELLALVVLALALLGLAAYMVSEGKMGEAFGAVITTLPLLIQAIRNIGTSTAMGDMVDGLTRSRPDPNAKDDC